MILGIIGGCFACCYTLFSFSVFGDGPGVGLAAIGFVVLKTPKVSKWIAAVGRLPPLTRGEPLYIGCIVVLNLR